MAALTVRDRRAIGLGGGALLLIVAAYFGLGPLLGSWRDARAAADVAAGRLADVESKMHRLLRQRQALEDDYGPSACGPLAGVEATRTELFKAAQDACRSAGLQEANYEPQTPRPVPELPGVQLLSIQVRGKCQLPQLAKCLGGLRDAERVVIVERLTATSNEKAALQPGMPATLEVTVVLASLATAPKQEKPQP